MRVADKMGFAQVDHGLTKNRNEMAEVQNKAATQKRVNKPSDDPLAATRVLATRTEISGGQQFLKSLSQAKAFLEYSDQSLGELSELLTRAKELALSQSNDASASSSTRAVTATEVEQLFNQSVQVGNRKLGDRFLFGGFKTTRPPFDSDGVYHGDDGEIKISIQKEGTVAMNMPGNRIFTGESLKPKKSAVGTGSGKSPDASTELKRPANDRPVNQPDDQNTPLRGPSAEGTSTELDLDDEPARIADLSSSSATKGVNIFRVLQDLATGLRANDKGSVQETLDSLDEALAQVVLSRAQLGSRVSTLNSANETLQKGQVDAKTLASSMEDADTFELVSELNKTESTLKASLATSGKLIQPSLLDFLR